MDFGYHNSEFVTQEDPRPDLSRTLERASFLDEAGFTWFSTMDHLWQIAVNGPPDEPFFDCYTVLPAVAAATENIELSALVTAPHYRNPAYLGRVLTTLDHLSDGRAVLGIGSGWFQDEYEGYGYEFPDISTRNRQMRETIELVEAMWTGDSPVSYAGEHYAIEDLYLEPKPVQDPRPPILVGGGGEELTLRATAEYADRWNVPGVSPAEYGEKLDVLRLHCERYGREYDEIEKTVLCSSVIRESTESGHEAYEELTAKAPMGPTPRDGFRGAVGSAEDAAAVFEAFGERGATTVMLKVPQHDRETIDRFVDEVMPTM